MDTRQIAKYAPFKTTSQELADVIKLQLHEIDLSHSFVRELMQINRPVGQSSGVKHILEVTPEIDLMFLEELFVRCQGKSYVADDANLFSGLRDSLQKQQNDFMCWPATGPHALERAIVSGKASVTQSSGYAPAAFMIGSSIWTVILGTPELWPYLEVNSLHADVLRGRLGKFMGIPVLSDMFRHPEHRTIQTNELWCMPRQELLGNLDVYEPEFTEITVNSPNTVKWEISHDTSIRAVLKKNVSRIILG